MNGLNSVQCHQEIILFAISYLTTCCRSPPHSWYSRLLQNFKTQFGYLNRLMLMYLSQMKIQNSNFHLLIPFSFHPRQFKPRFLSLETVAWRGNESLSCPPDSDYTMWCCLELHQGGQKTCLLEAVQSGCQWHPVTDARVGFLPGTFLWPLRCSPPIKGHSIIQVLGSGILNEFSLSFNCLSNQSAPCGGLFSSSGRA